MIFGKLSEFFRKFQGIGFEFSEIRPKPLAIYHVVVLVLFTLAGALLTLMVVCLPVYRVCGGTRHTEMAVNADRARQHALREVMMDYWNKFWCFRIRFIKGIFLQTLNGIGYNSFLIIFYLHILHFMCLKIGTLMRANLRK